jgi:hypothetical protein
MRWLLFGGRTIRYVKGLSLGCDTRTPAAREVFRSPRRNIGRARTRLYNVDKPHAQHVVAEVYDANSCPNHLGLPTQSGRRNLYSDSKCRSTWLNPFQ